MTRVALFGGSFNPPHVVHQLIGLYVLETQPVDELWFVPTYAHPFGKSLVDYEHRIAMCTLIAASLGPRAHVSRAEAELAARPGFVASHTLDLVELVASGGHQPRLVIGADILGEASKWHRWDDVIAIAPLIAIGRAGHPAPAGSVATEITMPAVSATRVRDLLARGSPDVTGLVPQSVLRYIGEHHLYQP